MTADHTVWWDMGPGIPQVTKVVSITPPHTT